MLLLTLAIVTPPAAAQRERPDRRLQRELEALTRDFHGDVGIYVRNLATSATASVRADDTFPTASMVKVPIMVGVFNARTPGREADYDRWGWGQTTPREMARLVTLIRERKVVSPAASEEMYRTMTRSFWTGEALSQLPPTVQAASKQGAVDKSRSEVVLVNAPSGDYVFCLITKNQQDESWHPDNEGYVLLRRVSALLWRHFEPRHPWTPAAGAAAFKP